MLNIQEPKRSRELFPLTCSLSDRDRWLTEPYLKKVIPGAGLASGPVPKALVCVKVPQLVPIVVDLSLLLSIGPWDLGEISGSSPSKMRIELNGYGDIWD